MKKRVLALIMSTTMVAAALTGCGSSKEETPAADSAASEAGAATEEVKDYGTGEIKVWVAENVKTFTETKIKAKTSTGCWDYDAGTGRAHLIDEGGKETLSVSLACIF